MDAPIRIVLLRDADKCETNPELMDARNKFTVGELEIEYYQWLDELA
ncbi:hypothetical protein Desaci_0803 [Desulfosporosinus acidiphilus SJ4]|uniref:Uncharacterized protein n=1 Tax=Desulfosporosinus acidiphilus (strain DSM 22704 / JCM 16185 / SJ4) TaxID=646529 RepID=I4D236_DESAJ|nr:hypothetical protein [Desulfosporosinus acidiphilus]AFM39860.1 hypothetical protein Desaci_0803 [Desulfosporosinus acidiphilus SJ4]